MNLKLVRNKIDKRYVSHAEFARSLGMHPLTLSRFLTGKTVLRPHYLMKVMDALDIDLETLRKVS